MALTHDASEIFRDMMRNDSKYRVAVLNEVLECIANGEADIAKELLRDYVDAIGFDKLAKFMDTQSIKRMLRPSVNPSLDSISKLLASLRKCEGAGLRVHAE